MLMKMVMRISHRTCKAEKNLDLEEKEILERPRQNGER